jgi:hypothetical protein
MAKMRKAIAYTRDHPEWPIRMPQPDILKFISQWDDVSEEYLSVKADLSVIVQRHQRFIQLQAPVPTPASTHKDLLAHQPLSSAQQSQPPPPTQNQAQAQPRPPPRPPLQTQQAPAQAESGDRTQWKTHGLRESRFASPVALSSSPAFPPLQSTSSAEIPRRSRAPPMAPPPRLSRSISRPPPQSTTQTGPDLPSASPASQDQTSRQPLMTHKQRMDAQERRQPDRKPQPRKAHPSEPAPEDRPGGKAPWRAFVPTIPVSACPEYPRDIRDNSKYNDLHMRPFIHLGLYSDEDPWLCYGIFAASGPRQCPYFNRPELCRNQHHINQRVLDWVFDHRGVTRARLKHMVGMYHRNTPASIWRSLRVPTGQSFKAATPASLGTCT